MRDQLIPCFCHQCATLFSVRTATLKIGLDAKLQQDLDWLSRHLDRSRSDLVREALRRQVALLRFEEARRAFLSLAEAQGILTDEDVFKIGSGKSSSMRIS